MPRKAALVTTSITHLRFEVMVTTTTELLLKTTLYEEVKDNFNRWRISPVGFFIDS
jgi:hypothetical protein